MFMLVSLSLLRYVISRTECVLWLVNFTGGILSSAFRLARAIDKGLWAISFTNEDSGKGIGSVLSVVSGPTPTPSYARAERNRTALIPIYPSFKKTFYQFRIKTVVFFPKTNSIDSFDSKLTFLERKICYVGQKLFLPEVIRRRFLLGKAGRLHLYDIFSLKYFRSKSTNLELQEKAPVIFRNWFSHIHKAGVGYLNLNFRDRYLTK